MTSNTPTVNGAVDPFRGNYTPASVETDNSCTTDDNSTLPLAKAKLEAFYHIVDDVIRGMSIVDAVAKHNANAAEYPTVYNSIATTLEPLTVEEMQAIFDNELEEFENEWTDDIKGNLASAIADDEAQRDLFKLTPEQQIVFASCIENGPQAYATPEKASEMIDRVRDPDKYNDPSKYPEAGFIPTWIADIPGLITAAEFETKTFAKPEWLIAGLILKRNPNPLWGDSYVGKTTLMVQAGVAIAAGKPFLGRAVERQRVILLLTEDPAGHIQETLELARRDLGVEPGALNGWLLIVTLTGDGPLEDFTLAHIDYDGKLTPGPYFPTMRTLLQSTRGLGVFVVLDTVKKFFGTEHSGQGVNAILRFLSTACQKYNATIVLNCHPSQRQMFNGRMTAGPEDWRSAPRSMLTFGKRRGRHTLDTVTNLLPHAAPLMLVQGERIFQIAADQTTEPDAPSAEPAATAEIEVHPIVKLVVETADRGRPIKKPRGPSGYDKAPFPQIEIPAREQWAIIEAAAEDGLLEYREGVGHAQAGYYAVAGVRVAEMPGSSEGLEGLI